MNTWLVLIAVLAALVAGLAAAFGKTSLRSIALWQIVGGTLIIVAWVVALNQAGSTEQSVLTMISALGIAALAIISGLLLWRGSPIGVRLSLVAQALQLAWVSLPIVQFGSTLGPTIGVRITSTTISFNMGFYGRGGLAIASGVRFPLDITVNVLAIVALLALVRFVRNATESAAA